MKYYYLAGAMTGLVDRGQNWRDEAEDLAPVGWEAINPNTSEATVAQNPAAIVRLDFHSILRSSAIVVRLDVPSWGTAMELLFAYQNRVPIIGFDAPAPEKRSTWLTHHVNVFVPTLEFAIMELKHVGVDHSRLIDSNR